MRKNNAGHIINFSSINGLFCKLIRAHYSAAKHAIEGFSKRFTWSYPHNIHVTLLEPGDHREAKRHIGSLNKIRQNAIRIHIIEW